MDKTLPLRYNGGERTFDVFFYGLYMDADLLASKGVVPRDPRRAVVDDRVVKLGAKAMLLRWPGGRACGMLFRLTHAEMDSLYADAPDYRCEAVSARLMNGDTSIPALAAVTMVHLNPPLDSIPDPDYGARWKSLLLRLGIADVAATTTDRRD